MANTNSELIIHAIVLLQQVLATGDVSLPEPRACPVERFVRARLIASTGFDLSGVELWIQYQLEIHAGRATSLSKHEFQKLLPGAMLRAFGIGRSHNVIRYGRRQRGFKNVAVKPNVECLKQLAAE